MPKEAIENKTVGPGLQERQNPIEVDEAMDTRKQQQQQPPQSTIQQPELYQYHQPHRGLNACHCRHPNSQQQQQQQQLQPPHSSSSLVVSSHAALARQRKSCCRNRSSAISAKSKTCYLSQYKVAKSAYFNAVLVTGRLPAASSAAAAAARKRLPTPTGRDS